MNATTKTDENFADLLKEFEKNEKVKQDGDIVGATVVDETNNYVVVDFNSKSLGFINKDEFKVINKPVEVGDEINAKVMVIDNGFGESILSYKSAMEENAWDEIENGEDKIKVRITKKRPNGLAGVYNYINVFIPSALVDVTPRFDAEELVGKEIEAVVVRADQKAGTIIASRRDALVSDEDKISYEDVEIGKEYTVKVTRVVNFGAFVYFGGLDGLIHISDIEWGYTRDINKHITAGDEVEAIVVSKKDGKVSLGLKQKNMEMWDKAKDVFSPGEEVDAKVVVVKKSGLVVESDGFEGIVLDKYIEGGVPFHAKRKINVGDNVKVHLVEFDEDRNSLIFGLNVAQFKKSQPEEESKEEE